ncbi:MAG TPA: hypothetical protein ENI74_09575 [Gammaproteobacteria bacterium]|nr:hypothetical protein [Gammaproteobacteria bacterium]
MIKRWGTPHAVMIPYDIFHAMRKENRQALRVDELTDEDIEAILDSHPPGMVETIAILMIEHAA